MKKGRLTAILWRNALVIAGLLSCVVTAKSAHAANNPPTAVTRHATDIKNSTATLNGTVTLNITDGDKVGNVLFLYGNEEGNYTNISEIVSINGINDNDIKITVDDLYPEDTCYFKIIAQNSVGTSYGDEKSFSVPAGSPESRGVINALVPNIVATPTPPAVTTGTATFECKEGGVIEATLCGTITVYGGLPTYYFFSYAGTSSCCLDNITEIGVIPIPGTSTPGPVDYSVCLPAYDLGTNTTYHYALWAQNKYNNKSRTSTGECKEFTTPDCEDGGGGQTAVELASFTAASAGGGKVSLHWETATEVDNAGFNIYRSKFPDGTYKKINNGLIPAPGNATTGATYSFEDTPGRGTFYYKLEDVDFYGESTMHGPEKVRIRAKDLASRKAKRR
ncbi:MAG: hypothetical protein B6D34_11335 [Candidatus Brocadia sp. UTAMX1]|nr:MAG: hypothetical protein B6D34_11335 [Candidatus Brocadia sp. UTAMX1]